MAKTEAVHTRVTHDIKQQADSIFSRLGLTTSQAITLFLTAAVNKNGMPFELTVPSKVEEELAFAVAIATVDGVEPSENAKEIFRLYKKGIIDIKTAKYILKGMYTKWKIPIYTKERMF